MIENRKTTAIAKSNGSTVKRLNFGCNQTAFIANGRAILRRFFRFTRRLLRLRDN